MTTITKEWLQQTIAEFENTRDDIPFGLDDDDAKILIVLKRALASLERERIRREHAEWSDKTFGDVGPVGPLKHLSKEALEAAADPSDPLEWADMQFLLWDAQRRMGISDEFITRAMIEKLEINKSRQWPEPKDGEPRLHIKEQLAPVVPPAIEPDYEVIKSILPTANPDEYACCIAADMWNACRADMLQGAEPVSQTYELPELIEGMEVSIDVSTCDADAGNRYFGTVTEISELYTAKNGYILLVQDAKPNFDVNGNSPVTPDGWISCSERMPEQGAYISAVSKHGEYVAGQVIDDWLDLHDGTSFGLDEVYLWMMLPPLPASPQQ
ncbi:DUF550 domain-containing protein [Salmonella enterica]|nr:DUF550 domain-containing protein [Salmonella enterica]ECO1038142.1 DUF550 domain-containing protein [Salmonella enterica subsp. enterica serovar Newport]EBE8513527.1 DUF550 domain-containing protein [Salmonella enterica]ECF8428914.1 DUF550 domain-containing protein [Salmonella enterica]ECH5548822.1 DUF550 domain-containing protein [Salmonella enterica]